MLNSLIITKQIAQRWSYGRIEKVIIFLLIMAFLFNLYLATVDVLSANISSHYGLTEFMINFEGGFVRRGLLGQLLYYLCSVTGISVQWVILTISYVALAFVLWFFFSKFKELNYSWWLILSPFFCGDPGAFVRKDFLLYSIIILMLWLIRGDAPSLIRRVLATVMGILALFIHEAFIFWGIPIFILLIWSKKTWKRISVALVFMMLSAFVLLCIFKGDLNTAYSIIESWNELMPSASIEYDYNSSIGAIGWHTMDTFIFHLKANTGMNLAAVFIRPIAALVTYYLITNMLFVFSKNQTNQKPAKTVISAVFLSSMIFMLPMFTVLSCDYGRLYQYATVTTFAAFTIIPHKSLIKIFPLFFVKFVIRLNNKLTQIIPPGRVIFIILLLFFAVSPVGFSLDKAYLHSVIGSDARCIHHIVKAVLSLIH